jgi:hypothetical protein
MTEDQLIERLRARRANSIGRIDMKTLPVPPLYEAVPCAWVDVSERVSGITFPTLLRSIYSEVGNGGFGPGGGLLGLTGGYPDSDGRTLLDRYQYLLGEGWVDGLLPLFDWGDGAWSAADARSSTGTIVTADESGFTETAFDLKSWFSAWTEGADLHSEIYEIEDAVIVNPFTRKSMGVRRRGRAKGKLL